MTKRLGWIAAVSFGVSAACGVLAVLVAAMAGGDHRSWAATTRTCAAMLWARKADSHDGVNANESTVDLEWAGSDAVKVNIPARVHYQPGPKPQASVSGNAELVSLVRMRDGTL